MRRYIKLIITSIYRNLPFSDERKRFLKDSIYKNFSFILKNTGMYKAWKEFNINYNTIIPTGNNFVQYNLNDYLDFMKIFYLKPFQKSFDYIEENTKCRVDLKKDDIKLIAFYLPQFHPIPENDKWWGKGFTEWTNVSKAVPQYIDHHQPQLPIDMGFYDLRNPAILKRQIELASKYGIYGFCFYYYWFGGKRLLEKPLDLFFSNFEDFNFPFCLCWANENWTRRWDGLENEILMAQNHSKEHDAILYKDLEKYFKDTRYIKIKGKPLFVIYKPQELPEPNKTIIKWRKYFRDVGIGEVYLVGAKTFGLDDPTRLGFDAAVEFPPHAINVPEITEKTKILNPFFQGKVFDYSYHVKNKSYLKDHSYTTFKTIFPGWDNTARRPNNGHIFHGSNPYAYKEWLDNIIEFTRKRFEKYNQYIFINAWNEWAEGAHLEPDRKYGYGFLQATANAILDSRKNNKKVISIIVPAYNHEKYINECIQSVANQTYPLKELIIIDDYSNDNTAKIITKLIEKDEIKQNFPEGIKFICHEENKGAHYSINEGLEAANGDYLTIINSDDLYEPLRLELTINHLELRRAQIAFSKVKTIDENSKASINEDSQFLDSIQNDILNFPKIHLALIKHNAAISTGNLVFTNTLFKKLNGFKHYSYIHDWDFILRSCLITEPIYIEDTYYLYRLHTDNAYKELKENTDLTNAEVLSTLSNFFNNLLKGNYSNEEISIKVLEEFINSIYLSNNILKIWNNCLALK